jgi:NADH-quinone oxidoreductase subunit F
MERILTRVLNGQASSKDLELLLDVANHIEGQTICALGDAAAWPVQSYLKWFRGEFEAKINKEAECPS